MMLGDNGPLLRLEATNRRGPKDIHLTGDGSLRCLMLPSRKIRKITEILRLRNSKGMHAAKESRSPGKTNKNPILSPTIYPRLIQLRSGLLQPLKSIPGPRARHQVPKVPDLTRITPQRLHQQSIAPRRILRKLFRRHKRGLRRIRHRTPVDP
jgi:hypothetical protein